MKSYGNLKLGYPQCPTRFFNFERFEDRAGDFILMPCYFDFKLLDTMEALRGKPIVYLEFDEPNRFMVDAPLFNHMEYDKRFAKVFTLCPFTAEWINKREGGDRWAPMFFPFNTEFLPEPQEKKFDIIYTGGVHSPSIVRMLKEMRAFDYRCVSQTPNRYVTDFDNTYREKLTMIAQSRVTIVHNLLYPGRQHLDFLRNVPGYSENLAFSRVPGRNPRFRLPFYDRLSWLPFVGDPEVLVPHIKSRLFEAAFCRSLILCRRDPWNLVERYFEPGSEFVYYESGQLETTLRDVLRNYGDYRPLIERAFERAMAQYTTEAFVRDHLQDLF